MEGHTLIYIVFLLGYLYFLARMIDRFNGLLKKRNKIKKPNDNRSESKDEWMHQIRAVQHEMKHLFKSSMIRILFIPAFEVICHFIVGHYHLNGQLLTLGFFLLFASIMAGTLYVMKLRADKLFNRKFDWNLMEHELNSRSE